MTTFVTFLLSGMGSAYYTTKLQEGYACRLYWFFFAVS